MPNLMVVGQTIQYTKREQPEKLGPRVTDFPVIFWRNFIKTA